MVLFANGIWSFRALGCFFSLPLWFITGYWIPEVSDPLDLRQTCAGRQVLQGEGARNKSGYSNFTDVGCCFSTTDATGDEDGVGENVWVRCAQDERWGLLVALAWKKGWGAYVIAIHEQRGNDLKFTHVVSPLVQRKPWAGHLWDQKPGFAI